MDANGFCEWLYDRCCHEEKVTLNKQQLNKIFPGEAHNALRDLDEFLKKKGLTLTVDDAKQTFTFELEGPDLRGF